MDRQTTLAFIIIGGILIIWLYFNTPTSPPPQQTQQNDTTKVLTDSTIKSPIVEKQEEVTKESDTSSQSFGKYFASGGDKERIITIENDVAVIELSTHGGNIRKYFLKNFLNWYSAGSDFSNYQTMVQLINSSLGNAYDLAFVTTDGKAINTRELFFKSNKEKSRYKLIGKDSLTIEFSLKAGEKGELKKSIHVLWSKV